MSQQFSPRTELGKQVINGKITDIAEIFRMGVKIREPWIVEKLLPNLKSDVLFFGGSPGKGGGITRTSTRRTARMHRSGRRYKISALVVVGSPGFIGLGKATANSHAIAIAKAMDVAKLNIIPIKRGCGSWECRCGKTHSIPVKIVGKNGSVVLTLIPAPAGIGLCIADEGKKVVRLAGIHDIWSKTEGQSRTRFNYAVALYNAFKELNKTKIELPETKTMADEIIEVPAEKDETAEIEAIEAKELASEVESKEVQEKKKKKDAVTARPELEGGAEVNDEE